MSYVKFFKVNSYNFWGLCSNMPLAKWIHRVFGWPFTGWFDFLDDIRCHQVSTTILRICYSTQSKPKLCFCPVHTCESFKLIVVNEATGYSHVGINVIPLKKIFCSFWLKSFMTGWRLKGSLWMGEKKVSHCGMKRRVMNSVSHLKLGLLVREWPKEWWYIFAFWNVEQAYGRINLKSRPSYCMLCVDVAGLISVLG